MLLQSVAILEDLTTYKMAYKKKHYLKNQKIEKNFLPKILSTNNQFPQIHTGENVIQKIIR